MFVCRFAGLQGCRVAGLQAEGEAGRVDSSTGKIFFACFTLPVIGIVHSPIHSPASPLYICIAYHTSSLYRRIPPPCTPPPPAANAILILIVGNFGYRSMMS